MNEKSIESAVQLLMNKASQEAEFKSVALVKSRHPNGFRARETSHMVRRLVVDELQLAFDESRFAMMLNNAKGTSIELAQSASARVLRRVAVACLVLSSLITCVVYEVVL